MTERLWFEFLIKPNGLPSGNLTYWNTYHVILRYPRHSFCQISATSLPWRAVFHRCRSEYHRLSVIILSRRVRFCMPFDSYRRGLRFVLVFISFPILWLDYFVFFFFFSFSSFLSSPSSTSLLLQQPGGKLFVYDLVILEACSCIQNWIFMMFA